MQDSQKDLYKDPATQEMLNTPAPDPTGASVKDKEFLNTVIQLLEAGKIDLYKADSIINGEIYAKMSEKQQGEIDLEALNILAALREIHGLWKLNQVDTFQMQSVVNRIRLTKERVEQNEGDVFIF